MSTGPLRPAVVETVIYEPDEHSVVAILPGALWLHAGDIVELDDPPREARVLSSRLQLRGDDPARVLVVLDVPDAALQGAVGSDALLAADAGAAAGTDLDAELERLTDEVDPEPAPQEP